MLHALMDGIQSLQLPPSRYLSRVELKFKISCALKHQQWKRIKKTTPPSLKVSSGPAFCSFWNTKTPEQVSDILSPAGKTPAPKRNRGEGNDTPAAKVASKGVKTLIETTPKNFQEAQKFSGKFIYERNKT